MADPDGTKVLKRIGLWGGTSALGIGLTAGAIGVSATAAVGAAAVGGLVAGFVVLVRSFKR